ncbi:MAG: YceI family protein, partial [Leptospiraceae bacterium]|nr:YceI family protein [Leptospiraceae bacterium]
MKRLKLSFTYLLLLHATFLYSQSYKYESKITFIASSRFGKEQGEFQKTNIVVTTNKIGSQVFVDVSSIYTGNKLRDNHLREEDFFYVSKYPYATLS